MLADDGIFPVIDQAFENVFGARNGTGEALAENLRVADRPADVNAGQNIFTIARLRFAELVFKILHALVKLLHFLNRPRQFEIKSRLRFVRVGVDVARRFAERRDERDFSLPHLKGEKQRAENQHEQYSNGQCKCVPLHKLFRCRDGDVEQVRPDFVFEIQLINFVAVR